MKKHIVLFLAITLFSSLITSGQDDVTSSDQNLITSSAISLDSLDIEPKFLDYTFLSSSRKKKKRKRLVYNMKNTMTECIQRHLSNTFRYPKMAQTQSLSGRVEIELIATKDGILEIKEVTGEHQILIDEAFRMVSLFPKEIIPGEKDGEIVNTSIKFPLTFKLQ
ncbi:MAG: energy transducer TonB [Maribacter sp.]